MCKGGGGGGGGRDRRAAEEKSWLGPLSRFSPPPPSCVKGDRSRGKGGAEGRGGEEWAKVKARWWVCGNLGGSKEQEGREKARRCKLSLLVRQLASQLLPHSLLPPSFSPSSSLAKVPTCVRLLFVVSSCTFSPAASSVPPFPPLAIHFRVLLLETLWVVVTRLSCDKEESFSFLSSALGR